MAFGFPDQEENLLNNMFPNNRAQQWEQSWNETLGANTGFGKTTTMEEQAGAAQAFLTGIAGSTNYPSAPASPFAGIAEHQNAKAGKTKKGSNPAKRSSSVSEAGSVKSQNRRKKEDSFYAAADLGLA